MYRTHLSKLPPTPTLSVSNSHCAELISGSVDNTLNMMGTLSSTAESAPRTTHDALAPYAPKR